MEFKEQKIKEFLDDLSSDKASPGGGSTAALILALSVALNKMVYSLTIGKKSFENLSEVDKDNMIKFNEKSKEYINKALKFMEKDRDDFMTLMDSYKLKKENEVDKEVRKRKIIENTINAMITPLNLARESITYYENILFAIEHGNKNLISDAGVSNILLNATIESAILNVKVNLNFLKTSQTKEYIENIEKECEELLYKSKNIKENLEKKVIEIIYK